MCDDFFQLKSVYSLCVFPAVIWNSEGCFKEAKKKKKRIFKKKFATVKGIKKKNPDIEKIYNTCKAKAEANGYEIFAIRVSID